MVIRWSMWGASVASNAAMLLDSVRSFWTVLGKGHDYVVFTDDRSALLDLVGDLAEVRTYGEIDRPVFHTAGLATWSKWCPLARLAPGDIEVHVDSDVFLLQWPSELLELSKPEFADQFLVLQEHLGATWQRGIFADLIPAEMPFINAGVFAQGPSADISANLISQYEWWRIQTQNISETFHDEQGALTSALVGSWRQGRLGLLPETRYKIISPRSNPGQSTLEGLVLFHATYPEHPAWQRFRHLLPGRTSA